MEGLISVFGHNLWGIDGVIIIVMIVNAIIYFTVCVPTNKIYEHFNRYDRLTNLSDETRRRIEKRTSRKEKTLTAEELLDLRVKANKKYALYTTITSMFPLMGMLGTVCSLLKMVELIGTESSSAFFTALTSTFWGIIAALLFKFLDATISYKIDDNEKHMDHYFSASGEEFLGVEI